MAGRLARLLAAAAVLLLAARPAAAQTCGTIDALARGTGKGANDAAKLAAMDKDPNVGLIYLPAATYRITTSLTLNKPIFGESGALLSVEKGVTLTINAQPEHPRKQLFKTSGGCAVVAQGWCCRRAGLRRRPACIHHARLHGNAGQQADGTGASGSACGDPAAC